MAFVNKNRVGSILPFVILTIVVAALLIGAIFMLRQRSQQTVNTGEVEIAQNDENTSFPAEDSQSENKDADDAKAQNSDESSQNADFPAEQSSESSQSSGGQSSATSTLPSATPEVNQSIPTTGPQDVWQAFLVVGSISYGAGALSWSLRALRRA